MQFTGGNLAKGIVDPNISYIESRVLGSVGSVRLWYYGRGHFGLLVLDNRKREEMSVRPRVGLLSCLVALGSWSLSFNIICDWQV